MDKCNDCRDYGVVHNYGDIVVWYEPITDEINGFVVRKKNEEIIALYPWDGYKYQPDFNYDPYSE